MKLFERIREIASRHALHRQIHAEMASLSDAELIDLDLSYARIAELSHRQAYAH